MLRAQYDRSGNIILGHSMPDVPSETQIWTLLEETHRDIKKITNMNSLPVKKPKSLIFHSVGTQTGKIIRQSVTEGGRQIQRTSEDARKEMKKVRRTLSSILQKTASSIRSFCHMAQMPIALFARKSGRRPSRKITLFLIDTVRFGGTFGLIFAVLFIGINYQSFWQIARAELALGGDIEAEQALTKITEGSSAVKALRAMQPSGGANILKYLPVVGPYEDRLIIPKLGINVPIVRPSMDALMKEDWKQFETDIQSALKGGVVHYPGSARPGQAGNFFVTGHSSYYPWDSGQYKDVFARLHGLDPGDTYTVYYGGDRHTYRVIKKYEVKPSNVSVLDQPTTKRFSTLMTCTPVGTTLRRLIVQAEEIDPDSGEILHVGEKTYATPTSPFTRLEALPI